MMIIVTILLRGTKEPRKLNTNKAKTKILSVDCGLMQKNVPGGTSRETEVLKFVAQGANNQEIAEKLFVREVTVKTHLKNIFLKLEIDSRSKAIAKAKELGLI